MNPSGSAPAAADICPLCGESNGCAMSRAGADPADCWCMRTPVAPEALARIPAAQRGRQCLCPHCAQATAGQPPRS
ncbi:MAG: cysteine-rich CWC family protein [Curvibacter sp.]|nr:cysteine-rich CWC family protein [Curvibacter sp.]